jgi:hypothetical protein
MIGLGLLGAAAVSHSAEVDNDKTKGMWKSSLESLFLKTAEETAYRMTPLVLPRSAAVADEKAVVHHVTNGGCFDDFAKAMGECHPSPPTSIVLQRGEHARRRRQGLRRGHGGAPQVLRPQPRHVQAPVPPRHGRVPRSGSQAVARAGKGKKTAPGSGGGLASREAELHMLLCMHGYSQRRSQRIAIKFDSYWVQLNPMDIALYELHIRV